MKRLLSEPLVHFAILGAAFFGLSWPSSPEPAGEQIVVTAGRIEHLSTMFARTWQRPPTAKELKGLIDDYVKEEVLSREAIKLKLDQDDTIIRRRLRQKMEFLAEDFAAAQEADGCCSWKRICANMLMRFAKPPRFTFVHIFPER